MTHLLTDFEAAELLRLNVRRLRRMARDGEVESVDLGDGTMRFDPDDLQRFVDGRRKPATGTLPAAAPA